MAMDSAEGEKCFDHQATTVLGLCASSEVNVGSIFEMLVLVPHTD
jgi:hypothetical protein